MVGTKTLYMVREPARNLQVSGGYDVVVAGGGIAGVAAAVAAARNGASVCILEKTCALGGLATLGNVTIWLPICDGMGRQVIAGLAEEMMKLSVQDLDRDCPSARFCQIPSCWLPAGNREERQKKRFQAEFNPSSYLMSLEKWVLGQGIKILYDTRVCALDMDGNQRIRHLFVENKNGRSAIACSVAVDATGDADLCQLGKESTESLDSNVLCGWFYHFDGQKLKLHQMSNRYSPEAKQDGAQGPFFRGDDATDLTNHILGTREMIRNRLDDVRKKNPEKEIHLINPPTIACMRMTRRLVSSFSLSASHVHQWFEDTVGLTGDWRKAGPVYAIPYRSLFGTKITNLLTAGRCISADTTAWDVTRAIPGCAATGEAAGTAAALAISRADGNVQTVPINTLQSRLRRQGVLLDPELVKPIA